MTPPLRRMLLCAALVVPVALVPACGKKNSGTSSGSGTDTPPPGGLPGGRRPGPPVADDSSSSAASGPIVTAGWNDQRLAAARQNSQNNLKQIAIAFHNYEATMGTFPAGIYDKAGKTVHLSWRVAILPYVEQNALYKEFNFDEPWDSEHNKKLLAKMPKLYAAPGTEPEKGLTYYRSFTGQGTPLNPQPGRPSNAPPGVPNAAAGLRITGITDGTSNTLLVVEARDPVPWTKPDELAYDPAKPAPKLGGVFEAGANVAMCDGSTRFLSKSIDEKTLRGVITANGGEIIQIP